MSSYYQRHIFFCLNQRDNGEDSCGQHHAQAGFEHCNKRIKSEGRGETREFSAGTCAKLTGKKLIDCFEPNRRVDVELLGSREVAAGSPAAGSGATGTR